MLVGALVLAVIIISATVAGVHFTTPKSTPTPVPSPVRMPDYGFNIMLADFGEMDDLEHGIPRPSENGRDLSNSLEEALRTLLADQLETNIQHSYVGLINGTTTAERERAASVLANKYNAHILIYGYLVNGPGIPQVYLRFSVNPKFVAGAEEAAGDNAFGAPLQLDIPPTVGRMWFREKTLPRFTALAQFVAGIGYYAASEATDSSSDSVQLLNSALGFFEQARLAEGWSDDKGKEILYLWYGASLNRLALVAEDTARACPIPTDEESEYTKPAWACAEAMHQKALDIQPDYARAYLALGNLTLDYANRLRTKADGRVDCSAYEDAVDYYQAALDLADEAGTTAYIALKAYYDIGASYAEKNMYCPMFSDSAEQAVSYLQLASEEYARVVQDYAPLPPPSPLQAAGAHSLYWLGTLEYQSGNFSEAAAAFEQVISLTEPNPDPNARYFEAWKSIRWRAYVKWANALFGLAEAGDATALEKALDAYLAVINQYETHSQDVSDKLAADVYLSAGLVYEQLGNRLQAEAYFEIVLTIDGASPETIAYAQDRLEAQ